jgi:hypothetical protein
MRTASQPICIWTPSGWKCVSSPMKVHYPGKRACRVLPPDQELAETVTKPVTDLLRRIGPKGVDPVVLGKVVGLMVAARVGRNTPFTIIKTP